MSHFTELMIQLTKITHSSTKVLAKKIEFTSQINIGCGIVHVTLHGKSVSMLHCLSSYMHALTFMISIYSCMHSILFSLFHFFLYYLKKLKKEKGFLNA